MDQITDHEDNPPRRKQRELSGVEEFLYPLRDWLGLISEDPSRSRETARARHRHIRNRMRRGGISPTSSLARRIVALNLIGLGLLVAGVLYLNQFRSGLIDQSTQNLQTQGEIIAAAVAEAAAIGPSGTRFDPVRANEVLRRLVQPSGARAQIYDRAGRLTGDTRNLLRGAGKVETRPLPPPGESADESFLELMERYYEDILEFFAGSPALYRETALDGVAEEKEVYSAIRGGVARSQRVNSEGELIVSVTVPIQRFKAVLGVLMLSTEGGDIDRIVRAERYSILQVFLVALAISLALSVLLANTIAKPIRRLAEAAEAGGAQEARPINPERIRFPDLTARPDEIGYLSSALRRMTEQLYERIDAIESFAADVAHEIKNPLTPIQLSAGRIKRKFRDAAGDQAEQLDQMTDVIVRKTEDLRRIVDEFSKFARMPEPDRSVQDLAQIVRDAVTLQETTDKLRLTSDLPGEAVRSDLDATMIGQALTNLIKNAGEAIESLVAKGAAPEGHEPRVHVEMRVDGKTSYIGISDNGIGLPEDRSRLFEPYVTTRAEGTGLGLPIVKKIIEEHGGTLVLADADPLDASGQIGARAEINLPLVAKTEQTLEKTSDQLVAE